MQKNKEKEVKNLEMLMPKNSELIDKDDNGNEKENKIKEKKNQCQFPSSFTIILFIYTIVFFLIYIIPKGKYDTIEYSKGIFIIKSENQLDIQVNATQEYLEKIGIKVPLSSFEKGYIKKPYSIPNTYKRIKGETTNIGNLFLYPILGLIDSADICFFLMLLGGCLNILNDMNVLSSGIKSLSRITKGKEFLLLCLIYLIISTGSNLYGMSTETLPFYPILMPIFLKNGIDGILGFASLFIGIYTGNMFSTVNAFSVVVASYSAGINFLDGIYFRLTCLIIIHIFTIIYFYHYYKKIKINEKNSIVFNIKKKLEDKYLKDLNKEQNEIEDNSKIGELVNEIKKDEFTLKQKIVLISFFCSIIVLVLGVIFFDWWFEHMSAIFLMIGIISMFFLGKTERESVKVFMKGISDYSEYAVYAGISRGIIITLNKGQIADTIVYKLSNITVGLHKIVFAILLFIIFIVLGILITGWTTLAILAIPVIAPLADEINCSRALVVNAYMFGQSYIQLISPTAGIIFILEFVGIPYNYWLRFIYTYMIILFIFLIVFLITNSFF